MAVPLRSHVRGMFARLPSRLPGLAAALCLLACGMALLPARRERVTFQFDIGHADGVAYAWQGRTLARGDGLRVPYVTGFFHPYPRDILRHDDQWPPLLAFALAPAFRAYGADASVARATNLAIATLALPLAFFFLVSTLTTRPWMGFFAALPLLASARIYRDGTDQLADLLLTTVFCLFLACLFRSRRHPAWLLAAGACYALAWYGKGSQILLGAFLAGGVLLLHGPRALVHRWHLGAWLVALLLMFPRLQYNAKHFGRPLHSTQDYVSSFFGLSDGEWTYWDHGFYSIWWSKDLPGPANRFDHPALHARSMRRNLEVFLRVLFLGLDADKDDWRKLGKRPLDWQRVLLDRDREAQVDDPATDVAPMSQWPFPWQSRAHLAGFAWGLLALPLLPFLWWRRRQRPEAVRPEEPLALAQASVLLLGCVLMQSLFVIVFWHGMERLAYPAWPALAALAWCLLALAWERGAALVRHLGKRIKPHRAFRVVPGLASVVACLLVAWNFIADAPRLHADQEATFRRPAPTEPRYPQVRELGLELAAKLPPDAILMCRNPWQTLWYSPEGFRAVGLPMAEPADLLSVAKYYGVTHLVLDRDRPGLREFIRAHPAAFRRVLRYPTPVFALDYAALPAGTLVSPETIRPYWDPRTGLREEEEALRKARAAAAR